MAVDILNPLTTLLAAFGGVFVAFLLERRARNLEKRDRDLEAANRLLYWLYERLNAIKLFQTDFIDPTRDDPAQMISMRPIFRFTVLSSKLNIQEVAFMFQTKHKEELLSLHICEQKFEEAANSIQVRSDLHLHAFQPLLEGAGYRMGDEITDLEIRRVIGERNYEMLRQATEAVVYNVDTFIQRGDELRGRLINAFSEVFSPKDVFKFKLIQDSNSNISQEQPQKSRVPEKFDSNQ